MFDLEYLWDEWFFKKFHKKNVSENKIYKKTCVNLWDELLIVKTTQTYCQGLENNHLGRILINEKFYNAGIRKKLIIKNIIIISL